MQLKVSYQVNNVKYEEKLNHHHKEMSAKKYS